MQLRKAINGIVLLFFLGVIFTFEAKAKKALTIEELLLDVFYVSGLHFPPMIIAPKGEQQATGIITDLTREILKRTGHRVEFKITNWARAMKEAEYGVSDALIPTMKSKDREAFLRFPKIPVLVLNYVLITQKGRKIDFNGSLDELVRYRILKLRDGRVTPAFDKAVEDGLLNIQERTDFTQVARGVASKRADLGTINNFNYFWIAEREGLFSLTDVVEPALGQTPVYLALSRNSTTDELAAGVSENIIEMIADGTYAKILKKYIGSQVDVKKLTDQILAYQ